VISFFKILTVSPARGWRKSSLGEKREILGEQRVPAQKRAVNRLYLNSFAGSVTKVRKARGKKC